MRLSVPVWLARKRPADPSHPECEVFPFIEGHGCESIGFAAVKVLTSDNMDAKRTGMLVSDGAAGKDAGTQIAIGRAMLAKSSGGQTAPSLERSCPEGSVP